MADDLTFESGGRIDAMSLTEASRNLPASALTGSGRTAWIFVPDSSVVALGGQLGATVGIGPGTLTAPELTAWLDRQGITYTERSIAGFDVVVPARAVSPAEIGVPVSET